MLAPLAISACTKQTVELSESENPLTKVSFTADIKPLLTENCIPCHNGETFLGGLNLQTRARAFRGTDNGPVIIAGNADQSPVYTRTERKHGKNSEVAEMPADGILLNDMQRDLLKRWIEDGAEWPEGEEGMLQPLKLEPDV